MSVLLVRLTVSVNLVIICVQYISCSDIKNSSSTALLCRVVVNNDTHQTESKCHRCSQCPRGTYTVQACSTSEDTVCKECPNGKYSDRDNSSRCHVCTDCADQGLSNVVECSRTEDTVCGCSEGTYLKNGTCIPCSKCPPGNQVSKTCGNDSDTECTTCRPGSFSIEENSNTYCTACHSCYRNRIKTQSCSPTTNTVCGGCKKGYFKEDNTANCAKCSYCYPEYPGYTVTVPECLDLVHDPNYTCMPVTTPPYVMNDGYRKDLNSVSSTETESSTESTTTVMVNGKDHAVLPDVHYVAMIVILSVIIFVFFMISGAYWFHCKNQKSDPKDYQSLNSVTHLLSVPSDSNRPALDRQLSMESGVELNESNRPQIPHVNQEVTLQTDKTGLESSHALDSIESYDSGFCDVKSESSVRPNPIDYGDEYRELKTNEDFVKSEEKSEPIERITLWNDNLTPVPSLITSCYVA